MRKFLSNFFIATSVVLLSNSVFGASFDCGLPSLNATEQFICKNPVISDLDERMAIIYAENYKKLSPTNRVAYLNGQRDWLKYWPQSCKRSYSSEQEASIYFECVKREYEQRMEILPVRKLNNQWLVFNVARYSVTKADPASVPDWVKAVNHSLIYPKIETANLGPADLQKANQTNAWIASVIKKLGLKNRITLNENSMDSFLDIEMEDVSPDITRLKTRYYFYGFGAHGNSIFNAFHFLYSKGRELREDDMLQGDWKGVTAVQILKKLKAEFAEMVLVNSSKDVAQSISKTQSWRFQKDSFIFFFNPYELTAYAAGAPEVSIPWSSLTNYLTEYAKTQLQEMY